MALKYYIELKKIIITGLILIIKIHKPLDINLRTNYSRLLIFKQ